MNLLNEIIKIYKEIDEKKLLDSIKEEHIQVNIESHEKNESFTVILEIIVPRLIHEDDYGIIFSTNSQKFSHFDSSSSSNQFLISDISFSTGEIIYSTQEFEYCPQDENFEKIIYDIKLMINQFLPLINKTLNDRYKAINNK